MESTISIPSLNFPSAKVDSPKTPKTSLPEEKRSGGGVLVAMSIVQIDMADKHVAHKSTHTYDPKLLQPFFWVQTHKILQTATKKIY